MAVHLLCTIISSISFNRRLSSAKLLMPLLAWIDAGSKVHGALSISKDKSRFLTFYRIIPHE